MLKKSFPDRVGGIWFGCRVADREPNLLSFVQIVWSRSHVSFKTSTGGSRGPWEPGPRPLSPWFFFSKSCSFQATVRKKPYFEQIFRAQDQNPGSGPDQSGWSSMDSPPGCFNNVYNVLSMACHSWIIHRDKNSVIMWRECLGASQSWIVKTTRCIYILYSRPHCCYMNALVVKGASVVKQNCYCADNTLTIMLSHSEETAHRILRYIFCSGDRVLLPNHWLFVAGSDITPHLITLHSQNLLETEFPISRISISLSSSCCVQHSSHCLSFTVFTQQENKCCCGHKAAGLLLQFFSSKCWQSFPHNFFLFLELCIMRGLKLL